MKLVTIIITIVGLALGTAIVGYFGFGEVASALGTIGWGGFFVVCLYHFTLMLMLGFAWYVIVPPPQRRLRAYLCGRVVRDSGSEVLPLSQVGGFIMGARAASLFGPTMTFAVASTVVDLTIEVIAQLGYTAIGLALLVRLHPGASLVHPVAIGIALGVVGILGFVLLQRRGAAFVERMSERLAASWLPSAAARAKPLQEALDDIYTHRAALLAGFGLHLIGWIANAVEAWIALRFMGVGLDIDAVLVIESLLYAIRSVAFAVPNAVGVQEGAYVMLGGLFGLPPDMALALSLLKRGRDLTIGIPALLAWQAIEGGALFRRRRATELDIDRDGGRTP
ncbi:MAG TPA: lysylphosphatidylglycerol synthase domain-containing protein [Stellaceae bacterium]|nr:lysylphosphatidylglycerol synthase domain-containing protein [Stellaceae bacterium]